MRPTFTWPTVPSAGSGLVEEALLDQPRALLRRHLDVARGEEEDLVGDLLHAAVERVGEAGGEVDEALGEVAVDALQVHDHRDLVLELVRDVLGVVEGLGDHEMDAGALAAAVGGLAADRAQPRGPRLGRGVVGEDVVDLVAAAAGRQAAHVGALAVAILEHGLGLAGLDLLLLVRVAILGEAEVDERAMPGVTKSHTRRSDSRSRAIPLHHDPYRRLPTRTMVAPSSTATVKSCEVPIDRRVNPWALGELAQRGEVAPAVLRILRERRHRHEAGDRDGSPLDERPELLRGDAGLALLPCDVHLDQDLGLRRPVGLELAQRGVRRDGVDQLDVRQDLLDLAALELADEVPAQLGVRGRLGLELLGAVLAHEREARLGEDAHLLERDVLDRGQQLDLVRVAAGLLRRHGGSPRAPPRSRRAPPRARAP